MVLHMRIAMISPDTSAAIRRNLQKLDLKPVEIPRCPSVEKPLSGHPDIQIFLHGTEVFCHPGIEAAFLKRIEKYAKVIICESRIREPYPLNISYNIACTGSIAFHKRSHTDSKIAEYLALRNIPLVNVNQGFAKCATLIINDNHIITADRSIHRVAEANNITSLLIESGVIELPGYQYGFIGGATGTLNDAVLFTGKISQHRDYKKICEGIEQTGKKIIHLSEENAVDLGTIFVI
jgi:hypothetical protein